MNLNYTQKSTVETFKKQFTLIGQTIVSFILLFAFFALLFLTISARNTTEIIENDQPNNHVYQEYSYHLHALDSIITDMQQLSNKIDQSSMMKKFYSARNEYKHIEYIVEYFFRETALKLNGPNLLESHPSKPKQPIYPTGFQVLEEHVFNSEEYSSEQVKKELDGIRYAIQRLLQNEHEVEFNQSLLFHALKLNIYRLITKGITGFDSPVAQNSLQEAISTLEATKTILETYPQSNQVVQSCENAINFVQNSRDFNSFDRAQFIQQHLNPLCDALHAYQLKHSIPFPQNSNFAIDPKASNLFSEAALNVYFFAPSDALPENDAIIALGKQLFQEKALSLDQSRSCTTCHNPEKAFTDGLKFNTIIGSSEMLTRNTPSLINVGFQNAQFMDSRISFIEDQAHAVITNQKEMSGNIDEILKRLNSNKTYSNQFKKVLNKKKIEERDLKLIIAAYVRSLTSFNSRFDLFMRGDSQQLTASEIKGFNLFAGKAKCATCHFIPLFNGSVPPYFDKIESEVLGVPNQLEKQGAKVDADLGKYEVYEIPHHKYSFKTTTVRNTEFTAPYMHNGVFNTMEEVIDFYEDGGGEAYGFNLEHQTLPGDKLQLTRQEKADLISFIKSLSEEKYRFNLAQNN